MRAAMFLRLLATRLADAVGSEGALLLTGTACLAVAASYISPAGPWFVVGSVTLALGLMLALPRRSA